MSESQQNQSYVAVVRHIHKKSVAKAPLAGIPGPLPRTGERIFLPLQQPGHWEAYTVVAVEYFLGGKQPASEGPQRHRGWTGSLSMLND